MYIFCVEQQIISHLHKHLVAKNDVFFVRYVSGALGYFVRSTMRLCFIYTVGGPRNDDDGDNGDGATQQDHLYII